MIPELWSHQKEAIQKATDKYALFFDPGCGKSRTALELFNKSPYNNAVIFAPLNVCRNWQTEIEMYSKTKKVFIVAGQSKVKKLTILEEYIKYGAPSILVMNIECLRSSDYMGFANIVPLGFVIVDESHNFKSPTSLQTKGLMALLEKRKPKYVYLLTGTPAPQGEMDLWSSFYMLGRTNLPFYIWRKKYFVDVNESRKGNSNYFPKYIVRDSSKTEFQRTLSACSSTAKKDKVMDLPPLLREKVYCELSVEQRRNYKSMFEYLFAIGDDGETLNASNFLSRTLRLQQIVAGFVGDKEIKSTRLDALEYAIEQTQGEQFIIWTIFTITYKQISKLLDELGITFGLLTGAQSASERFDYMNDFQSGKIRALIAHPKAGGVGVNLTAASYSIHYTKNFNLVDDLQCEARNYRGGSERHKRITRIDIIAQDTIDEKITDALENKKTIQDLILGLKQWENKSV